MNAVTTTDLKGLRLMNRGKVRDVYEVSDEHLLLVATDRISAFDVVMPVPVPGKGIILTQLSLFWFELLKDITGNHLVEADVDAMPMAVRAHRDVLAGRSMLVRRAQVYPAECIVRGFLLGSGWKDYQRSQTVCGIPLPPGLKKNHRFDPALFTPSTKAVVGHDENISFEVLAETVGQDLASELKAKSLATYHRAFAHAHDRGIIICDTKFEWGDIGGKVTLVDEVLTPDSSRFWKREDAERHLPNGDPPSFDKQVVRDYLETLTWDKKAPGPVIPDEVLSLARSRYIEIYERIAGRKVPCL
ncbi:MAG TPA: phosphoribosylaminoimidazolesuccinocarboxamide synthase [Planctomycetota bacterium]|jgi:phosphoribosylaminoimidazole-succinocarboxamide synthase|nr:phosphoribosylaminoimidazolesuccinocarboxamide synthase [Planctomycetota bacterium]